ncbi:hypothetical protein Tco_0854760 [Tanacetum coccineum]
MCKGDYGVADNNYEGAPVFDDDQFEDELEMGDDAFMLIRKEVSLNSEIHEAMFPLLEEFSNVFLDELHDGLPPLRDIQHHIDLESVQDFVEGLHEVHKAISDNLVRANSKYKQDANQKRQKVDFEVSDFVWAVLIKDCFSVGEYNKLSAKKISPLEIVEKINTNVYRLKLPSRIRCFDVFNVKHLLPYQGDSSDDDLVGNSRTNFVYPGGNDAGPSVGERALLFLEAQDRVKKRPW